MIRIFNNEDKLICIAQSGNKKSLPLLECHVHEVLNGDINLEFVVPLDHSQADRIQINYSAAVLVSSKWQLFIITEIEDSKEDERTRRVFARHAMWELQGEIVSGLYKDGVSATEAIDSVIEGTRWTRGYIDPNAGSCTIDLASGTKLDALKQCLWDTEVEIDFSFEFGTATAGTLGLPKSYIKQKCLDLTGLFETSEVAPAFYGGVAGNFDDAGLSWGVVQFNFGSGTLQPIFRDLLNNHASTVRAAFTDTTHYDKFRDVVLNKTQADQIAWGEEITDRVNDPSGHKVAEPWATYFYNLGISQPSIDRQIVALDHYYNLADGWMTTYDFFTRRAYSLLFDIAIQNGGISTTTHDLIMADFAAIDTTGKTAEQIETEKMLIVANRRADAATAEWQADVRSRKTTIANGAGTVHGFTVDLDDYELTLDPLEGTEVVTTSDRSKITARKINIYEQRGSVTYRRFTWGKDIESLRRSVNTENLKTVLIGRGKTTEKDDGTEETVTITNIQGSSERETVNLLDIFQSIPKDSTLNWSSYQTGATPAVMEFSQLHTITDWQGETFDRSIRLTAKSGGGESIILSYYGKRPNIKAYVGKTITGSAYMRSNVAKNGLVRFEFFNAAGTMISGNSGTPKQLTNTSNQWTRVEHSVTVPTGAETVNVLFYLQNCGINDQLFVTLAQLEPGSPATSWIRGGTRRAYTYTPKYYGHDYIQDLDARNTYGRLHTNPDGGTWRRNIWGYFIDEQIEDEKLLLRATARELLRLKQPEYSYEIKVIDIARTETGRAFSPLALGDTIIIVDTQLLYTVNNGKVSARVIEIKHDLINPEETELILNKFMPVFTNPNPRRIR